jgi:hypothetical protein
MFLPDEFLVLAIAGLGVGVIVGLVKGRAAMAFLGMVVLVIVLSPFVEGLVASLPGWMTLLLLVFIGFGLVRALAGMVLGRGAANEMTGSLAASAVRWVFLLPFRLVGFVFRLAFGKR